MKRVELVQKERYTFDDLCRIMELLRSENGCPWDREQTHESIRKNFIEEVYEVCEAIDGKDAEGMVEELGDVMMQVVFHALIGQENGEFEMSDVFDGVCKKLIVRHPHVFGELTLESGTSEEVLSNWENIKNSTKKNATVLSPIEQVPKCFPALMRIQKIAKRAQKAGVETPCDDVRAALAAFEQNADMSRAGELLAAVSELLRKNGVDAEEALELYANDYTRRILE